MVLVDEPYDKVIIEQSTEEKWEYAMNQNDFWHGVFSLGFSRVSQRYVRTVKRKRTEHYDAAGNLISTEYSDYEYSNWEPTDTYRRSKGWTGGPGDVSNWTTQPGVGVYGSVSLDKRKPGYNDTTKFNKEIDYDGTQSKVAVKQSGYDFQTTGYSMDEELPTFYAKGPGLNDRRAFLTDYDSQLLNEGDIIIKPGVTKEQVLSTGFGYNSDFFEISPEVLSKAKSPNSVGQVPSDYDFLVITRIERSDKRVNQKDGSYMYTTGTIRSWVDVYKIED